MGEFNDNVAALAAQQAAPVKAAQAELSPTRSTLLHDRDAFRKLRASLLPVFDAAQDKQQQAASVGVVHSALRSLLMDVFGNGTMPGLLEGAVSSYEDAIRQIDSINALSLQRDPYLVKRLLAAPARLRASAGALDDLARRVQEACHGLEEMIRSRAGQPPPVMTAPEPRPARVGIPIETEFDPRA